MCIRRYIYHKNLSRYSSIRIIILCTKYLGPKYWIYNTHWRKNNFHIIRQFPWVDEFISLIPWDTTQIFHHLFTLGIYQSTLDMYATSCISKPNRLNDSMTVCAQIKNTFWICCFFVHNYTTDKCYIFQYIFYK